MIHFLWQWLLLPLIHWLIVSLLIVWLGKLGEAKKLVDESARALAVPAPARMAEVTFQVTRADGTVEPPRTYRTYRNPFLRWGWAIKTAFCECLSGRGDRSGPPPSAAPPPRPPRSRGAVVTAVPCPRAPLSCGPSSAAAPSGPAGPRPDDGADTLRPRHDWCADT